jgi:hypothetical protein
MFQLGTLELALEFRTPFVLSLKPAAQMLLPSFSHAHNSEKMEIIQLCDRSHCKLFQPHATIDFSDTIWRHQIAAGSPG